MAAGKGLPPTPPPARDPKELVTPSWQRWLSLIGDSIKSLLTADQQNQFAGGASGAGCYSNPARVAGTVYTTGNSPRFVTVQLNVTAAADGGSLTVGGTLVAKQTVGAAGACTITVSAIVPAGTDYSLTLAGGAIIASWSEL